MDKINRNGVFSCAFCCCSHLLHSGEWSQMSECSSGRWNLACNVDQHHWWWWAFYFCIRFSNWIAGVWCKCTNQLNEANASSNANRLQTSCSKVTNTWCVLCFMENFFPIFRSSAPFSRIVCVCARALFYFLRLCCTHTPWLRCAFLILWQG